MKIKNTLIGALIPLIQSKWIQPAFLTLGLAVVLGVTGCDSGHGGNHGK